ncbi:MAG: rhodanese-like domain-containing protein [Burkholderiaceae bacterium]|uniref:rhodanese-like domain-containing protein n=1 Tax=Hydrogenophaga sp. TaxID=1904254 RepID=UPI0027518DBD|nr:rhodanese-like domain-containing protein [Hydrogenophaga sp.]MDP2067136.1 rhodanese-like domain-containing protein [Burkholderiaceae bacterium]MDZ4143354.1 rhodanese-like domain-containing protein [Burkholderiales bacterium]MDZ4397671.1 rhodanese-like domain-containing protein [Hydrogenophaga sp.]
MIVQVRPADLAAWLQSVASDAAALPVVLDVREPWELQTASVQPAGFRLVPIPMGDVPARLSELDPDTPIACLCHHGARSLRVAAFLAQNGFDPVANIHGGIEAWSGELDPAVPRY